MLEDSRKLTRRAASPQEGEALVKINPLFTSVVAEANEGEVRHGFLPSISNIKVLY